MRLPVSLALAALLATSVALAGCADDSLATPRPGKGVVRQIDRMANVLAVAHEPIPGFLGPATTTFAAPRASMLEGIHVGDAVEFRVRFFHGRYEVTELRKR